MDSRHNSVDSGYSGVFCTLSYRIALDPSRHGEPALRKGFVSRLPTYSPRICSTYDEQSRCHLTVTPDQLQTLNFEDKILTVHTKTDTQSHESVRRQLATIGKDDFVGTEESQDLADLRISFSFKK